MIDSESIEIKDFHAWCFDQAELLKSRKYEEIDINNFIEEVESMGRHERDRLTSALRVLFMHLLKYIYQPTHRSKSWLLSIKEQRSQVKWLLDDSPSLDSCFDKCCAKAYYRARIEASDETGLSLKTFPKTIPFEVKDALKAGWLP